VTASRPARQRPEPGRAWIAWSPSSWSCGPELWTDLARGRLEGHRPFREQLPELDLLGVDDLLYVPPVRKDLRQERDRWVAEAVETGAPVLVQVLPGEACEVVGVRTIVDLLPALLDGDPGRLASLGEGGVALWAIVPGLTDGPELQEEVCALLEERGLVGLQVLVPEIPSVLRRRLGESSPEVFDALFHASPLTERGLVRIAHRHGLAPFMARRPVGHPRIVRNREIAAVLAQVAELTIRLGDPMAEAQVFLRAARGAEASQRDLVALVREGNLQLLEWVDSRTVEIVEELARDGTHSRLDDLMARYLGS
jgi:hypothetical protein